MIKKNLKELSFFLFDLDNTLYPFESNIFSQVKKKITDYISKSFDLNSENSEKERQRLYNKYGTSFRGSMVEQKIEPGFFLDFVHDIDLSSLKKNNKLNEVLEKIPQKKIIFTNASYNYSQKVLSKLGIAENFSSIYSIETANYIPKPNIETYYNIIDIEKIIARSTIMFEDTSWNLKPAFQLGMKTVLIHPKKFSFNKKKYINYNTSNIVEFLK